MLRALSLREAARLNPLLGIKPATNKKAPREAPIGLAKNVSKDLA